jgi:gluconolactonase
VSPVAAAATTLALVAIMRRALIAAAVGLAIAAGAPEARAADVERVARDLQFPEGTIFVGDTLYFVDYATSDVLRLVAGKVETVFHQDGCWANGLLAVGAGLLVACYGNGTVIRISLDGRLLETIRADADGKPFESPNDFTADAKGGVYFTGSGSGAAIPGKVYHRAADGRVTAVASDIGFANGLAVSPDGGLLYVVETSARRLLRFAIAADGTLRERRVFVTLADILADRGRKGFTPDSLRIDAHGNLFVALYEGGGFAVLSPAGTLLNQVDVPGAHHTNLAIAPDGKSLIVTAVDDVPNGAYRGALYRVPNPVAE